MRGNKRKKMETRRKRGRFAWLVRVGQVPGGVRRGAKSKERRRARAAEAPSSNEERRKEANKKKCKLGGARARGRRGRDALERVGN